MTEQEKRPPFRDRLASFVQEARERVSRLPPGPERDDMLNKLNRQANVAIHLDEWLNSPGLQPPK